MTTHNLKTWPLYYSRVIHGFKTVELRKDDREFKVGDTLILEEWDPQMEMYTGRSCERLVTDILKGAPWLADGYVAMSIRNSRQYEALERIEKMLSEMDALYRTVSVMPVVTASGTTWNCEVLESGTSIAFAENRPSMLEAVEEAYKQFQKWNDRAD